MKKLFVVLMALCLFVLPVMAQTQDEPQEVTWTELEESLISSHRR